MNLDTMGIPQERRIFLAALGIIFLVAGNQCQTQPGFQMDDAFDDSNNPLLDDPFTRDEMGSDSPFANDQVFPTNPGGVGGGGGGGGGGAGGAFSTGGSNTGNTGGGLSAFFTQQLMEVTRRLQAKPRGQGTNVAKSLEQMLTQFSAYGQLVPPNFHLDSQMDFDDHCFHTPGQLNRFFSRIGSLFDESAEKVSAEKDSAEKAGGKSIIKPISLDNLGDDLGDLTSSEKMNLDTAAASTRASSENAGAVSATGSVVPVASVQQSGEDEVTPTIMVDDAFDDTIASEEMVARKRRNVGGLSFDLSEAMDKMDVGDIECMKNFMSDWEREELCSIFSKRFSGIFSKLYSSGFDCDDMLEIDDLDDDGLDMQHQIIMETQFRSHPRDTWSDAQVKRLMTFAPNALGEDFIEDLPDDLFRTNLKTIGRIAAGRNSNPSLREAFREKLDDLGLETFSEDGIHQLGPGLLALSLDQLNNLDGKLLINAKISNLFDDDDDDSTERFDGNDNDYDDDDDDSYFMRYSIGQMMKKAINRTGFDNSQLIARTLPFLNDDVDFIRKLNPEALFNALPQIQRFHFDTEDAVEMLEKLRERSDILHSGQGNVVRRLGALMKGFHAPEIEELERDDLEDALEDLIDIDFDDDQAEAIVEQLLDENIAPNYGSVMKLGKLARGLSMQHIQQMGPQDLRELIDFQGLYFSPVKQNAIAQKIRQGGFPVKSIMSLYETFSDDDLEDLFEEDSAGFMDLSIDIDWEPLQAVTVASLVKRQFGSQNLRPTNLPSLRNVAIGLLPSDIDDMIESDDDALNIIEVLEDAHERLNSVQIDTLKERFMEISSSESGSMLPVGQKLALQGGTIMAYLDEDDFDKLEFDSEGETAFLAQVYKMSTKKMSRSHVAFLARNIMSMTGGQTMTPYSRLRALGKTALGLTPKQLKSIGGKAIIDNLDIMRTLPFTKLQAKAILESVEDVEPEWECRSDIVARLGPLLQHLDDDMDTPCEEALLSSLPAIMKGLDKYRESVMERVEEGFAREEDDVIDEDGTARLVSLTIDAYNTPDVERRRRSVRRRQASTESLSCSLVQQLRGSAAHIPHDYLQKLPVTQITTCLAEVGNISDWKQTAIQTLLQGLKSVEGVVSEWREDTVRRAGSLVSGMSPADIQQMRITGVDTLNSIGKHKRLNREQLKAGVQQWMRLTQKKTAGDITEGELASLSEFVCGLEPAQITQLSDPAFKRSLRVIGRSTSCSQKQTTAYVNKLISIHGDNVKLWKPTLVAEIGSLLGHLGRDRLQSLTSDQLSLISPVVIQNLPVHAISALRKHQLKSLGTNQINAMTNEQFYSLSESQQAVVAPKASVAFHHQDNGAVPNSSTSILLASFAAILASLFC